MALDARVVLHGKEMSFENLPRPAMLPQLMHEQKYDGKDERAEKVVITRDTVAGGDAMVINSERMAA